MAWFLTSARCRGWYDISAYCRAWGGLFHNVSPSIKRGWVDYVFVISSSFILFYFIVCVKVPSCSRPELHRLFFEIQNYLSEWPLSCGNPFQLRASSSPVCICDSVIGVCVCVFSWTKLVEATDKQPSSIRQVSITVTATSEYFNSCAEEALSQSRATSSWVEKAETTLQSFSPLFLYSPMVTTRRELHTLKNVQILREGGAWWHEPMPGWIITV